MLGVSAIVSLLLAAAFAFLAPDAHALQKPVDSNECKQGGGQRSDWTPTERTAWCKIVRGETVKLGKSDSIRSRFLTDVLFQKPYREVVEDKGLRIEGGRVTGEVDWSDRTLPRRVSIVRSEVAGLVTIKRATSDGLLSFEGTAFDKAVDLSFSKLHQVEFYDASLIEFEMAAASVGKQFVMVRSRVRGKVNLFSSRFDQSVYFNEAEIGNLESKRVIVKGDLNLRGVTLERATLDGANIEGSLWLDHNLQRNVCTKMTWRGGDSGLSLRDAKANAVITNSFTDEFWPKHVELEGFTYQRLARPQRRGTCDGKAVGELLAEPPDEFIQWLARADFSPQPYDQLALTLTRQGYSDTASEVLVEKKRLERAQSWARCSTRQIGECGRAVFLALSWALIGYGYDLLFRPLLWIVAFTLLGLYAFRKSSEGRQFVQAREGSGLAYSFESLVPLISLREKHKKVDFSGPARYYFYVHRVAGYVLASFVVAGISGLTKQ